MSTDERGDSLAAQAAAWVPPWERPQRPPDRDFQAAAEEEARDEQEVAAENNAAADSAVEDDNAPADVGPDGSAEADDFAPAFEGANPTGYRGTVDAAPRAAATEGGVDHPAGEDPDRGPTDVPAGPEISVPDAVEQAAEQAPEGEPGIPVDAPLPADGDDAGDVFDVAADDDLSDDGEMDLPVSEEVPLTDTEEPEATHDDAGKAGPEAAADDVAKAKPEAGPADADAPGLAADHSSRPGSGSEPGGATTGDGDATRSLAASTSSPVASTDKSEMPGANVVGVDAANADAAEAGAVGANNNSGAASTGKTGATFAEDAATAATDTRKAGAEGSPATGAAPAEGSPATGAAPAAGKNGRGGKKRERTSPNGTSAPGGSPGRAPVPAQQNRAAGDPAAGGDPGDRTSELPVLIDDAELAAALEAILLVVDEPVAEMQLAQILELPTERVGLVLEDISARYTAAGHGFDLRRAAGGWRLYTRPEYAAYVERFVLDGQSVRLTQAALETLAVVAYKQPVTRSRISAIRGVNCDGVMRTLVTRGLIEECGTEGETGAFLYRTTPVFLEKLGLNSIDQLPPLAPFLPDDVEEVLDASG